ncbi:GMC oxidoreductase [Collybia nuda]|uniref:GMC oxidoreductase n=1 Tax=Collybia nuda TaxID=64659 RepID=A0A9P5XVI9_9AGAR|nr:GMC oxidoreductase [Collybia nuda]
MWSREIFLTIVASLSLPVLCSSHIPNNYHHARALHIRNYVTSASVADSYDFIIAGGGLAGLVIASRLSEDPDTTVLVLEAGESGDDVPSFLNPPAGTYYDSLLGTSYDWAHKTVPQRNAGDRIMPWPRGKVLGGSSAINGMYFVRPSEVEVNAWKDMIASDDASSSEAWEWNNFLKSMKKSENFTPPRAEVEAMANIRYQADSIGAGGPMQVSYPGFMLPVVGNWLPSLEATGIASAPDPTGGKNYGGFVAALSINPTNWTRSYSKSAYIDPLPPRKNLDILVSSTVTKIIFDEKSDSASRVATGVEFSSTASGPRKVVNVKKEVIVTGGALGSPHILMHSGVGPKDVLDAAGVPLVSELPGLGQHLQDHMTALVVWDAKVETAGDIQQSGSEISKQAEFMSFVNSAIAYVNTSTLFAANAGEFQTNIRNALAESAETLVPSKSQEVVEGYKAIYSATEKLMPEGLGQIELLLSINSPGAIAIQAALQHAFSQGRVYINSTSIFDPIVVDPNYFSHFADLVTMREGLKLARRVGQASPMRDALGPETFPGPGVSSDAQIDDWLRGNAQTEFHPAATCAMLPRSQGGVVNAKLQVYGLANVRVADASVFPLSFSAHLASPTYGLAEQAADIIKTLYKTPSAPNDSSNNGDSDSDPNADNSSNSKNGGISLGSGIPSFSGAIWRTMICVVAFLVIF